MCVSIVKHELLLAVKFCCLLLDLYEDFILLPYGPANDGIEYLIIGIENDWTFLLCRK